MLGMSRSVRGFLRWAGGFTLAELLVVVVTIGVLAAIAIPVFLSQADKASDASLKSELVNAAKLLQVAEANGETLPAEITAGEVVDLGSAGTFTSNQNLTVTGSGETLCVEGTSDSGDVFSADLSEGVRNYDCAGFENGSDVIVLSYPDTSFTQGVAGQVAEPSVRGGLQDRVFSVTGDLPEGVAFDSSTGVFSGPSAGEWNFRAEQVVGTQNYACVLTVESGVKCWGRNNWGQLGDGTTVQRSEPVDVVGLTSGVVQVSASNDRTCALLDDGTVKCWGYNGYGQLGDGTKTESSVPVTATVVDGDVESIALAAHTTCVLYTDNRVECWGANYGGQLGGGTTANEVTGFTGDVKSIYGEGYNLCAVLVSEQVQCWGGNAYGQLGDGTTESRSTPVHVLDEQGVALTGVESLALGGSHTCALLTSGGVKCWGRGSFGQLGDGFSEDQLSPVDVVGLSSGVTDVSAGHNHTCALLDSGDLKCWGYNNYGMLGDGSRDSSAVPVDVTNLPSKIVSVATGRWHTCAVLDTFGAKCWGRNYYGEVGVGAPGWRISPTDVLNSGPHPGFPAMVDVLVEDGSASASVSVTLTLD